MSEIHPYRSNSFGIYKKNSLILKYHIQENLIFAAVLNLNAKLIWQQPSY